MRTIGKPIQPTSTGTQTGTVQGKISKKSETVPFNSTSGTRYRGNRETFSRFYSILKAKSPKRNAKIRLAGTGQTGIKTKKPSQLSTRVGKGIETIPELSKLRK